MANAGGSSSTDGSAATVTVEINGINFTEVVTKVTQKVTTTITAGKQTTVSVYTTTVPTTSTIIASHVPLTTVFKPSPSCFSSFAVITNQLYIAPVFDADCYPSGWVSKSWPTFSPGLCPSGYHSVGDATYGSVVQGTSIYETVQSCCPSNYIASNSQVCYSVINPGHTPTTTIITTVDVFSAYPPISQTPLVQTTITTGTVRAALIQVAYASTDTKILSLMSSTSLAAASSGSHSNHSGLSSGALAGAIIGPIVFLLLLLAGVFFLLYRRKKNRNTDYPAVDYQKGSSVEAPVESSIDREALPEVVDNQMSQDNTYKHQDKNEEPHEVLELDGRPIHEAHTELPEAEGSPGLVPNQIERTS